MAPRAAVVARATWLGCLTPDPATRSALGEGARIAVPVPLTTGHPVGRLVALFTARVRVFKARRFLATARATRVHVLAIVPGDDALFLAYELGRPAQTYVEERIMFRPVRQALHVRCIKSVLRAVSGAAFDAELIAVVGEPA